jgi:hypothetical protein
MALLKSLELIEQLGCAWVIVESNSLEPIQICNGTIEVWSPYSSIIVDCFTKANAISDISFQHCSRDANKVAHNLARNAYISKNSLVWDGDPTGFIINDVIEDVTIFII